MMRTTGINAINTYSYSFKGNDALQSSNNIPSNKTQPSEKFKKESTRIYSYALGIAGITTIGALIYAMVRGQIEKIKQLEGRVQGLSKILNEMPEAKKIAEMLKINLD